MTDTKNTGGPAFPREDYQTDDAPGQKGMTLRDWFGGLIPRDEITPKIKAAILDAQLRAFEQGRIDTPSEIEAKALTAIKESKDD